MTESTPETMAFFDRLHKTVEELVKPGGEFETLALFVDHDYRGLKYDAFSVRVRNDGKATGRGIVETHHYDY